MASYVNYSVNSWSKLNEIVISFYDDSVFLVKVAAKKQTLKNVTDYITDVICKRADCGYNYGVILIPEGLIDFIPEVYTTTISLYALLSHMHCWLQSQVLNSC